MGWINSYNTAVWFDERLSIHYFLISGIELKRYLNAIIVHSRTVSKNYFIRLCCNYLWDEEILDSLNDMLPGQTALTEHEYSSE